MVGRAALVLAALVAVFSWPGPGPARAQGQTVCAARDSFAAQLAQGYNERPVARGLGANGDLVEVFASPGGTTWTILVTRPRGFSCVAATGADFEILAPVPAPREGKGDPS